MTVQIERHTYPTQDPRLDWAPAHDPRSGNYPIRARVGSAVEPRPVRHRTGPRLDQGREGACVGFAWTAELIGSPRPDPEVSKVAGDAFARGVYRRALQIDEWAGEEDKGTSVNAGGKVIVERDLIEGYYWSFSVEDLRDGVIEHGPAVIGIPWLSRMYTVPSNHLMEIGGDVVGGHALLVSGYHPNMRFSMHGHWEYLEAFELTNSWGGHWGRGGQAWIRAEDLRDLLAQWGEAAFAEGRQLVRLGA